MTTLTFPLSRIEGHARVEIEVREGQVISTRFQAMEKRGFNLMVQGAPAEQMPVIVPRICGVCSTAHHVASVKALEDAYGVEPPPLANEIRELLLLGQLIQNQATSLFVFTMPDRLGVESIFHISEEEADTTAQFNIAKRALMVRQLGTDLITLAGGQFIHPVKAVVGGVSGGIETEKADAFRKRLEAALPVACELVDYYWDISMAMKDRIGTWGDDQPAYYIASTERDNPRYNSSIIRVMTPAGECCREFSADAFRRELVFEETDYSYAGRTSYQGGVIRANSLARANMTRRMGIRRADAYMRRLRSEFGHPAHPILLFDLCRGIELVYAIELAGQLLEQDFSHQEVDIPYTPRDGEGWGLVEAPRGPLIHHYVIEKGNIAMGEFIIPTVHNMLAIERALRVAAERYIRDDQVNLELEKAVGRVVRAFDPCIACATH
ncbi:MAG: F420-non-reducing hydrogenase large subunit [Chloroflexota bacterium]|nr:F420-non-reducing hydrogenase large subunit [Chloroflexota bacterium]